MAGLCQGGGRGQCSGHHAGSAAIHKLRWCTKTMSTARHPPHTVRPMARITALCCLLSLAACSSVNFDQSLALTNQQANAFTQGELALVRSEAQKAAMERTTAELLAQPLTRDNAVRLALVHSPALHEGVEAAHSELSHTPQHRAMLVGSVLTARARPSSARNK